jgi:hypothetical protein
VLNCTRSCWTLEIEVLPLERRDLAHAKTEALGNNHHRSIWLFQHSEDGFVLSHSQNGWALTPFGTVLDSDHLHGVSTVVEEFPAACTFEHQVHDAADMGLRLRGHFQFLQPTFDHHWPNLVQQVRLRVEQA